MMVTLSSNAQMKVEEKTPSTDIGKIGIMGNTLATLTKYEPDSFIFSFKDASYSTRTVIRYIAFKDIDGALDGFYKVLQDGFTNTPKDVILLDFPDDKVTLKFTKNMGVVSLKIFSTSKSTGITGESGYFTKKQINKLFGKG